MSRDTSPEDQEQQRILREAFGKVLREKRLARQLRMVDLETVEGIKRSQISYIEAGKSQICLQGLFQVAEALDIPPEDLIRDVRQRYEKEMRQKKSRRYSV